MSHYWASWSHSNRRGPEHTPPHPSLSDPIPLLAILAILAAPIVHKNQKWPNQPSLNRNTYCCKKWGKIRADEAIWLPGQHQQILRFQTWWFVVEAHSIMSVDRSSNFQVAWCFHHTRHTEDRKGPLFLVFLIPLTLVSSSEGWRLRLLETRHHKDMRLFRPPVPASQVTPDNIPLTKDASLALGSLRLRISAKPSGWLVSMHRHEGSRWEILVKKREILGNHWEPQQRVE
ncbi:predicted protein [Histoplasma capsulatum var. duboisii H88]|uniref:Predicted protein n=1 Tax=Ajellomyces capsulatus (strain H88) TaxID=544711 RepID=F0UCT9_AJEC8|nr:predicted protein [Histoplasma capsulatum var. duboisii H88]